MGPAQRQSSHQAHVGLLDAQLELQGMLEAVHGPACVSSGAGAALGNPVSDIAVRAILMPCTLMFAKDICADACCIVPI